jgi:hypothetical protein
MGLGVIFKHLGIQAIACTFVCENAKTDIHCACNKLYTGNKIE